MTILKPIKVPNEEIEDFIDDEVLDEALNLIEDYLRDKYEIEHSDLASPEYIFFLNIMKKKIDERIARWI